MSYPIVDTHIHNWNFSKAKYSWLDGDTSILNRTYNVEEIEAERLAVGIKQGVLVQSANNLEDTDWMLETAASSSWIDGVVGWMPLQDPVATSKLLQEKYLLNPHFKGVRHLIHDEPNTDWLLQPTVLESLQILADHNLTYDIVGVLPAHIETVLVVAEKVPSLKMVFDHLNQPPMKTNQRFGAWGELMKTASQHQNFHAKISGLGTATANINDWGVDDVLPYVDYILQHFGADRCFCGGDWPVSFLAGSYTKTWSTHKAVLQQLLDEQEQEKVFANNARQFYKL